jgi:hypothetical protein
MSNGTTVRDETIILDWLRFHYRDWGDPSAPPLILLHACTNHARSWDTIARALADDCLVTLIGTVPDLLWGRSHFKGRV